MPELKFQDVYSPSVQIGFTLGTAYDNTALTFIPNGTGPSNRIGRKITLRYFEMKGHINLIQGTTGTADMMRIIVGVDKQTNGTAATLADVLADIPTALDMQAPLLLANQDRWSFLFDRIFTINTQAGGVDPGGVSSGQVFKSFNMQTMCNIPIEYDGITGDISEVRSNSLHVWAISTTGTAYLNYTARVRFSDN